jgi:hypothetical protein
VVELELLQGGERPVALLEQAEALRGGRIVLVGAVGPALGVAEKGARDEEDEGDREPRGEEERGGLHD